MRRRLRVLSGVAFPSLAGRGSPGMEALQGKSLTQQEKEKLKEQLAFLKREYRKTFQRLQRAERAERVKNDVKEKPAEQPKSLREEKDPEGKRAEPLGPMPPEASERVLARAPLDPSPAKAVPVLLGPGPGPGPELAPREDNLPETSGSERSTPDPDGTLFYPVGPRPEKERNRLSRSGAKARRRATLALEERGGAACAPLRNKAGCQRGGEAGSLGSSGSPTFRRRGSNVESEPNVPSTPSSAAGGGCGIAVLEPRLGPPGQNVCLGASSPLSKAGPYENRVSSHRSLQGAFANSDLERAAAWDDVRRWEQESVQMEEEPVWGAEEELGQGAREAPRGGGGGISPPGSGPGMLEERSQWEESRNLGLDGGETSLSKPMEMGLESQADAGALPKPPTQSPLSSCTVVEGLLFPVEYYVRTTRRMSRCQREVDLSAVLQGQLGKRRRRRGKGGSLAWPSPVPAGSDGRPGAASFPPAGARVSPGREAVSPPQPLPPVPRQGLGQPRRGRRPRGGAGHRAAPGASPPRDCSGLASLGTPGWGAALPVGGGGCLEARPAGTALGLEGAWSSHTTVPGAGSTVSCASGLEVGSEVRPPERRAGEQEGPCRPAGAELVPPNTPPVPPQEEAAWKSGSGAAAAAAPPGGEGGARCLGAQPQPLDASRKDLPFQLHLQGSREAGDESGRCEPKACVVEPLGILGPARSVESLRPAGSSGPEAGSPPGGNLGRVSLEAEPQLPQKGLPPRRLLLPPGPEGIGSQLESQPPTLVFPLVGATPASQPASGAAPPHAAQGSRPKPQGRTRPEEEEALGLEERRASAGQTGEPCRESPKQGCQIETGVDALRGSQRGRALQMTSKLQASSSSCSVDVSALWWGAVGSAEFCIAVACESSVSLWRLLDADRWGELHTWHLAEAPVSRIVPLPDVHSLLCVALGGWEMAEIRLLGPPSEGGSPEQSQVKVGDIKAVLGLRNRRLVIGCGSLPNQTVEVVSFSEAGRSEKRQSLTPPQENILTLAEVDGMPHALVGLMATNGVVVWNLKTGQLLRRIPLGQPVPASACHKAFSDSGLLFVVLSCSHAAESEAGGTTAFQVVALNPKTARSTGVALLTLPPRIAGRCVEGHVRGTSAAAVLTSGTIAVWDLLLAQCTALLPPSDEGSWSLARWSVTDNCLLARRTDGSIYVYSHTARLPCP